MHGIQAFLDNGQELLWNYHPRNIIQVQTVNALVNPTGRIHPYGSYRGSFKWVILGAPVYMPWKAIQIIRHSDKSIEWKTITTDNTQALPSGGEYYGIGVTILGLIER